jgi:ankyrin repeat protein
MEPRQEIVTAIQTGAQDRVEALLDAEPDLLNERSSDGDSPLLTAIYCSRREICEMLMRRGADVGLHEASALGLGDAVAITLDRDSSLIHAYSHDGWTALHLAAFFGRREVAELLIGRGADVNARSRNERFGKSNTPLHAAAANGQTATAELLIEKGAEINATDGSGFTPLALAASTHNDILMIQLLERGARVG